MSVAAACTIVARPTRGWVCVLSLIRMRPAGPTLENRPHHERHLRRVLTRWKPPVWWPGDEATHLDDSAFRGAGLSRGAGILNMKRSTDNWLPESAIFSP